MPTQQATYEDANLVLRLYELRREEKLRTARAWFAANFQASTVEDMQRIAPPEARKTPMCGWWRATGRCSRP